MYLPIRILHCEVWPGLITLASVQFLHTVFPRGNICSFLGYKMHPFYTPIMHNGYQTFYLTNLWIIFLIFINSLRIMSILHREGLYTGYYCVFYNCLSAFERKTVCCMSPSFLVSQEESSSIPITWEKEIIPGSCFNSILLVD